MKRLSSEGLCSPPAEPWEALYQPFTAIIYSFPVAQLVEHGASNAKIMGSIPRESKSW